MADSMKIQDIREVELSTKEPSDASHIYVEEDGVFRRHSLDAMKLAVQPDVEKEARAYATAAAASEKAAAASATDAASSAKTASDASATVSEYEALWLGAENWRQLRMHQNILDNVEETVIDVALTNSQTYPHNNSQKTVAFETYRNKTDYYVYLEVIASSGGSVGDVVISDKLVNGFKVAYTGSATSATVRCHVFGGM